MKTSQVPIAGPLTVLLGLLPVALLTAPTPAAGAVTVTRVVTQDRPSPDGNGRFGGWFQYGDPCVNDSGQVAFAAQLWSSALGSSDDEVLVRAEPNGTLYIIAREGGAIPGGTGTFGSLMSYGVRQYAMNNGGIVAFTTDLRGTPGGSTDNWALFRSGGAGTTIQLARRGDSAPYTGMVFNGIDPPSINFQSPPAVAFYASLNSGSLPSTLYIHDGAALSLTSWYGQGAPGGNGYINKFFDTMPPALRSNDAEVAFWAHLGGTLGGYLDDDGVFRSKYGVIAKIARGGEPAPGGNTYSEFTEPVYDLFGNAAFMNRFDPVPGGGVGELVVGDGSDDLAGRSGRELPDSTGWFKDFYPPSLSAGNVAAFKADLSGTPGGANDDSGIYRGDGTILYQIARENQVVPEGGGKFSSFGNIVGINAQAEVLFTALLRDTPGGSSDNWGLYLWNEYTGITKLLRTGDVIDGGVVLDFSTLNSRDPGGIKYLNDASTAVAKVQMAGYPWNHGIYLFRVSHPLAVEALAARPHLALAAGPNPWGRGSLYLKYSLARGAGRPITISAHDVSGRVVRTLYRGIASATGEVRWDGRDDRGAEVASGVYFVRLDSSEGRAVRRVVRVGQ